MVGSPSLTAYKLRLHFSHGSYSWGCRRGVLVAAFASPLFPFSAAQSCHGFCHLVIPFTVRGREPSTDLVLGTVAQLEKVCFFVERP